MIINIVEKFILEKKMNYGIYQNLERERFAIEKRITEINHEILKIEEQQMTILESPMEMEIIDESHQTQDHRTQGIPQQSISFNAKKI